VRKKDFIFVVGRWRRFSDRYRDTRKQFCSTTSCTL